MSLYDCLPDEIDGFTRYSSCIRKKRYATEEEAKYAIYKLRKFGEEKPLHPYFCPFCYMWHVGGCEPEEEIKTRIIDGMPFTRDSTQRSPEDAKRRREVLLRKGYHVRVRRKNNNSRTRKLYQIYKYRKPEGEE